MNVQEFTDRIKRLYPKIKDPTKRSWDKAIRPIKSIKVIDITDDIARDYLEGGMEKWAESTVKQRIGLLKGIWIKISAELRPELCRYLRATKGSCTRAKTLGLTWMTAWR